MELQLVRTDLTPKSSVGTLSIDGRFECFTLEDAVRPVKIKGLTAIPYGAYEVVVSWSQRFRRRLPLLLAVPNFDGIRIHAGNTDADTDGCILVGLTKSVDAIGKSRLAFDALFAKLEAASAREKIFIAIEPAGSNDLARPLALARNTSSLRRALTSATTKPASIAMSAAGRTSTRRHSR
jgi:hypothetical protein